MCAAQLFSKFPNYIEVGVGYSSIKYNKKITQRLRSTPQLPLRILLIFGDGIYMVINIILVEIPIGILV